MKYHLNGGILQFVKFCSVVTTFRHFFLFLFSFFLTWCVLQEWEKYESFIFYFHTNFVRRRRHPHYRQSPAPKERLFLDWACQMHLCKVSKLIFILAFYLTLLLAFACCFIHLTLNTKKKNREYKYFVYVFVSHNANGIAFDEKYLASLCVMIIYHCSKSGNVNGCARFTWVWIGEKSFFLWTL